MSRYLKRFVVATTLTDAVKFKPEFKPENRRGEIYFGDENRRDWHNVLKHRGNNLGISDNNTSWLQSIVTYDLRDKFLKEQSIDADNEVFLVFLEREKKYCQCLQESLKKSLLEIIGMQNLRSVEELDRIVSEYNKNYDVAEIKRLDEDEEILEKVIITNQKIDQFKRQIREFKINIPKINQSFRLFEYNRKLLDGRHNSNVDYYADTLNLLNRI